MLEKIDIFYRTWYSKVREFSSIVEVFAPSLTCWLKVEMVKSNSSSATA